MYQHLDIIPAWLHSVAMRTTLTIDDDLLAVARSLAQARAVGIGRAVSDLMRRGLDATPRLGKRQKSGFPVFNVPPNAHPVTLGDVKGLEDEP